MVCKFESTLDRFRELLNTFAHNNDLAKKCLQRIKHINDCEILLQKLLDVLPGWVPFLSLESSTTLDQKTLVHVPSEFFQNEDLSQVINLLLQI